MYFLHYFHKNLIFTSFSKHPSNRIWSTKILFTYTTWKYKLLCPGWWKKIQIDFLDNLAGFLALVTYYATMWQKIDTNCQNYTCHNVGKKLWQLAVWIYCTWNLWQKCGISVLFSDWLIFCHKWKIKLQFCLLHFVISIFAVWDSLHNGKMYLLKFRVRSFFLFCFFFFFFFLNSGNFHFSLIN